LGLAWQGDDDQDGSGSARVFFATCARLIGPEVKLTIEQTLPGNQAGFF
jgi:hypothetical protein